MKVLKASGKTQSGNQEELALKVRQIIADVKNRGDRAVLEYNEKFDGSQRKELKVLRCEIEEAYQLIDSSLLEALKISLRNLKAFAKMQKSTLRELEEQEIMPGVFVGHRTLAVDSCCCYVPGGKYPLFSSALMLVAPAKSAGVKRIAACSPPQRETGKVAPETLVALDLAGVDEIYAVGGAQAIAAAAYGTEQIKPVDLLVGPGNQYVTEAKRQCFGQIGIDALAGPSEVLIIADWQGRAEIIAADLLAQAEHDPQARSILVTTSAKLGREVLLEIERQLRSLPTEAVAREAWENNGEIFIVDNLAEACDFANATAPEHLEVMVEDPENIAGKLNNYGSLFLGEHSAEVFGDYITGTNHTLPTGGAARYTGGLWVGTFLKVCTHQRITDKGLQSIAGPTRILAEGEGLYGHSSAVSIREKMRIGSNNGKIALDK